MARGDRHRRQAGGSVSVLAIDVAILVPDAVGRAAREVSRALSAGRPDALRLDRTHLPHITLAQQFVERSRLPELNEQLDRLLRHEPDLRLRIPAAEINHGTVAFLLDESPDLQRLHESIMDVVEPFESPEGGSDAFEADGETIRPQDVDWVRNYREDAAYTHYRPHVTLGHGDRTPPVDPIEFRAGRVAVCRLGRFCTCRAIVREWTLGAGGV